MTPAEQIARLPKRAPAEGRTVGTDKIDALRVVWSETLDTAERRAWFDAITASARHAVLDDGSTLTLHMGKPDNRRTERRYLIVSGLLDIVRAGAVEDDDQHEADRIVRSFAAAAIGQDFPHFPAITIGAAVGAMNATQAATFADLCQRLAAGSLTLVVTDDGTYQAVA